MCIAHKGGFLQPPLISKTLFTLLRNLPSLYRNEFKSWGFGKAAKTREGPVDLRSAKQVSKANRAEGAPEFESGEAGAEAAQLE